MFQEIYFFFFQETYERWHIRIPTGCLNRWLKSFIEHFPTPWVNQSKVDLQYLVQVCIYSKLPVLSPRLIITHRSIQMQVRPPLFVLYSNVFGEMPKGYFMMFKNHLIEEFGLYGSPIRVLLRTTKPPPKANVKKLKRHRMLMLYKRSKPYDVSPTWILGHGSTHNFQKKFKNPIGREGRKIDLSY